MMLSRRIFIGVAGVAALSGSRAIVAPGRSRGDTNGADRRPLALLLMGHDQDVAFWEGAGGHAGSSGALNEKPSSDDLYSWIQTQCDRLAGCRLAAISDDVGELMLSMALRDRGSAIVFQGRHGPSAAHSAAMDHSFTFFGQPDTRARLGSTLARQGWFAPNLADQPAGSLIAKSPSQGWALPFGAALADAFTGTAGAAVALQPGRTAGFDSMQPGRSLLADI